MSDTLRMLQDLFLVFTSVLFIVDPLTAVPTFLAMTARDPPEVRRLMAKRGAWTCAITLTAFALGGSLIFRLFGITIGAFKVAGGILIGLNALDMVQARRSQQRETAVEKAEGIEKEDVGIMPLGVPMLAGPGAISTVMVLAGASKSVVTTVGVYVDRAYGLPDLRHASRRTAGGAKTRPDGHAHSDATHGARAVRDCRAVHYRRDQDGGSLIRNTGHGKGETLCS